MLSFVSAAQLGKGGFGTVFAGTHRILGMHVAIKETKPNDLDLRRSGRQIRSYDDLEQYCQEIKVLRLLQENEHAPRNSIVLLLHEYFMSGGKVYIVTERLGWELEEWRTTCDFFSEKNAIDICRTILTAIDFMASRGVVHRDIKMPNILFREEGDFQTLKIVDFGMACVLEGDASARDFCGSIGYIAPEIYYHKSYRFEVDMFAFGVLLFRLLSGQRPFPSTDHDILRTYTVQLRYDVDSQDWEGVSSSAKDLVRHLLINREERLTVQQALNHEWFLEEGSSIIRTDLTHDGSAVSRAIAVVSSQLDFLNF